MRTSNRSTVIRSPTTSMVPGGRVARTARVSAPSTTDTGTTAPSFRVAHTVATSPAVAFETDPLERVSIRWIVRADSDSGTPVPTWRARRRGRERRERSEVGPAETIKETSTRLSGADSNRCVNRQFRHRATPLTWPLFARLRGSNRRIRWGVAVPQFSQTSVAARIRVSGSRPRGSDRFSLSLSDIRSLVAGTILPASRISTGQSS
jgi:hypothetical protein